MKAATSPLNLKSGNSVFQSTPPVKAATAESVEAFGRVQISIHAAREGGDDKKLPYRLHGEISIHAAREGGDYRIPQHFLPGRNFNPRRP